MAYDQNAAYEPPRRNYMPQPPAANPAQNGYDNDYAEYASTPYDQYDYAQGYGHQQSGGFDSQLAHSNGHAGGYQNGAYDRPQPSQDRAYDPRYQPRVQKGPALGQGQPPAQRGPPPQGRQPYQPDPRQNGQQPRPRDHRDQRGPDTRGRSNGPPHGAGQDSMADWKAREKAKFKKQAQAPENLPLDNAFPMFPKRNETSMDRSGAAGSRGSGDRSRPQTSGSSRPRGDGHATSLPSKPEYDRHDSNEQDYGRQNGAPQYDYDREGADQHSSEYDQYPAQWPMVDDQAPPRPQTANDAGRGYALDSRGQQHQQRQVPQHRGPHVQLERHAYSDRQPHGIAGPRPATSHGQAVSPTRHHPQDPRPWVQQGPASDSGHESLGDIYDDYGADNHAAEPQPGQLKRVPTTRDEEIEAEMPDFDSAAPGQTSRIHKKAIPPPINSLATATPPPISSARSAPPGVQGNGHSQRPAYDQSSRSTPGPGPPRGGPPPVRGATDPYGGPSNQMQGPPQGYDLPYRGTPQQGPGYGRGGPMQPPRAPFANEPPVRRSLDDARQGPRRPGPGQHPPQQRFDQYGRPIRPPQGRPDMDRSATWADPRQARGPGGAGPLPPPHQQGSGGPPNSAPLPQQLPNRQAQPGGSGYNPDALPQHPVPVRPGLMDQAEQQAVKPPPVRNYNGAGSMTSTSSGPPPPPSAHDRQASIDRFAQPVTLAEIDQLRASVDSTNSPKQGLILVKKLVEAAAVLATEGGRADQKTTARNRERYITEAYKRLKKLVTNGYPDAQFYLADCYGQGMLGLEVDPKEAFKLYQAAAKAGHAQAAYRTAVCCEIGPEDGGGTSRDYPKAVQWYRRAAALGDAAAMYKLGAILLKGLLGQSKNIAEAVTWLKRGAERADVDHPHALHELAGLYETSNTNPEIRNKVIADDVYARELFQKAAALGYKFSQFRLGQAYEYGALGLPTDNRTSISWYTKAAAQGEHQAELALSGWYLTGAEGILEHSETEAYLWARKAAASEPPLPKAMFAMGYYTESGIGCPASMEEARKWYGRAASHKFPKAIERLEELKRGKSAKAAPSHGKLSRKEGKRDQKKDEENCSVM